LGLLVLLWLLGFAVFLATMPAPLVGPRTDAIVVLTGSAGRIDRGLTLLQGHMAKRMLISGVAPEVRPAELAQINAARRVSSDSQGWRQTFLWPTTGRISTLFGSQRIYKNGEAGSYHSGVDIAKPQGSVILAPADGVVVLAADNPFTL
ncbi:M23 family metallopeptidase, partial [Pseudomonas sp. EL_65y_Pfl1_R83]|uniref:M23 family metallopeptidase n=1 Tax=Pseudomonas sp. EL_65y_Pfl1_R83 TaxID=3088697 RepID=UPI00403F3057